MASLLDAECLVENLTAYSRLVLPFIALKFLGLVINNFTRGTNCESSKRERFHPSDFAVTCRELTSSDALYQCFYHLLALC